MQSLQKSIAKTLFQPNLSKEFPMPEPNRLTQEDSDTDSRLFANAITLRGIVCKLTKGITFIAFDDASTEDMTDNFNLPWGELSKLVQKKWIHLAQHVIEATRPPRRTNALELLVLSALQRRLEEPCDEPDCKTCHPDENAPAASPEN